MVISIETFSGAAIAPRVPILAGLCNTVFREWPHLYDDDGTYDPAHLQGLADSSGAMLVIVYDRDRPVGASTCLPLADATPNVQAPFIARNWPLQRFFYLAESVLLPKYRGQGIGKEFFALREAHARSFSDCDFTCFCAIQRSADHPGRPAGVVPLDAFWRMRNYQPIPGMYCNMSWREIGDTEDSQATLGFWIKSLTGAALPKGDDAQR